MLEIIRKSFKITNNYIVIATPLILFSLFASIYLILSSTGNTLSLIITAILFFLMVGAFLSGWLYMIKRVVTNSEEENKDRLIFEFPSGVGEYFLSILGLIIVIIIVSVGIFICTALLGKKLIGSAGISYSQLSNAVYNVETMKTFLDSLSTDQLSKLKVWNLLLFFSMVFNYFVIMFYSPVLFFKEKNPFKAFLITIKDTFGRKIIKNFALFSLIFVTYFILSILIAIFGRNIFAHFILTLINFYYVTYIAIFIFNYAKIGSQVDTLV